MNGLPYYKRYPRDFIEGTIKLPFELKVTYGFVLDLIYMQGGKLPDDSRYIAGLLGVSVRKWNALRQGLISAGKIAPIDGHLTNSRAFIELESLAKVQDKQRENRSRPNKIKDLPSPWSNHTDTDKESKNPPTPLSKENQVAFDAFWKAYPKQVGKRGAELKFKAAIKRGVDPGDIISGASKYAGCDQVKKGYVKNATTWLNNGCWEDNHGPAERVYQDAFGGGEVVR